MKYKNRNVFPYWGGKSNLCEWVISHFPSNYDKLYYVEPFCGSAVVLLNKMPSRKEVISDVDKNLFFAYRAIRERPDELRRLLENTLYSQNELSYASDILDGKEKKDDWLYCGWAKIVSLQLSMLATGKRGDIPCSFHETSGNRSQNFRECVNRIEEVKKRLANVYVLCKDALKVIEQMDRSDAFFYLDPPYPETNQEGYKSGYTLDDFNRLTTMLKKIKGKYLISFELKDGMECKDELDGRYMYTKEIVRSTQKYTKENKSVEVRSFESLLCNYRPECREQIGLDSLELYPSIEVVS